MYQHCYIGLITYNLLFLPVAFLAELFCRKARHQALTAVMASEFAEIPGWVNPPPVHEVADSVPVSDELAMEIPAGQPEPVPSCPALAGGTETPRELNLQTSDKLFESLFGDGLSSNTEQLFDPSEAEFDLSKLLEGHGLTKEVNAGAASSSAAPSDKQVAFSSALSAGTFDLRSGVGQTWQAMKKHDATLAAAYKAVGKSYEAQRSFRMAWAQTEHDSLERVRTKEQSQVVSSGSFGQKATTCPDVTHNSGYNKYDKGRRITFMTPAQTNMGHAGVRCTLPYVVYPEPCTTSRHGAVFEQGATNRSLSLCGMRAATGRQPSLQQTSSPAR